MTKLLGSTENQDTQGGNSKRCPTCKALKPFSEFPPSRGHAGGVAAYCRLCNRLYHRRRYHARLSEARAYYQKNRTRLLARYAEYRAKTRHLQQQPQKRYGRYKSTAKNRGRNFELSYEVFCELTSQPCRYCGSFDKDGQFVGLDRKDSALGYTLDNVLPCCFRCNEMKMDESPVDFALQVARIAEHLALNPI